VVRDPADTPVVRTGPVAIPTPNDQPGNRQGDPPADQIERRLEKATDQKSGDDDQNSDPRKGEKEIE
jgi:hypothetical protein